MITADERAIALKADRLRFVGVQGTLQVIEKNAKYSDAIRKVRDKMMADYPNGITPDQYGDVLLWVRVQDKLTRAAAMTPERRAADDESPWADIRGYGLLGEEKDLDPELSGLAAGSYEV